jgi:hypothetical protein
MACGTPVVALRRGSVPEIIVNGVTGIVTDHPAQLPEAIGLARQLDPAACQAHVASRFTTELMAARYEDAYRRVLGEKALASGTRQLDRRPGMAARWSPARRQPVTARSSPAASGVALLGRERVEADAGHGLAKPAGYLGDDGGVVVERGRLHDRRRPGGGVA